MALYSNLPVYKAAYDLLIALFKTTGNLSREYKFTIGEELKKGMLQVIKNIYQANKEYDKLESIGMARQELELIGLQVRILKDLKQIGLRNQIVLNEKIMMVSRQLAGWEKSCRNKGLDKKQ